MNITAKCLCVAAVLSLSLSGCGDKKSPASRSAENAVKVNGQAVSVAELDVKTGNGDGQGKHAISPAKLKQMIDLELMRQAALQAKLDADEHVRARVENSGRSILAMAYMDKLLATIAKPTEAEIADYYKQNPARFSERKQYQFNEFIIQPPAEKVAEIQAKLAKGINSSEFEQWLSENKIPHGNSPVAATGERLPDELLSKLKDVHVGGTVVMGDNQHMSVLFIMAEQLEPVAMSEAQALIAQMLMDKRKSGAFETAIKQLREKAKIEYVAPYTEKGFTPSEAN